MLYALLVGSWKNIMTSKPRSVLYVGVLYIGVTSNIAARTYQHRSGHGSAFCRKYGLDRLVLVEPHGEIIAAIAREKALKAWKREWKIRLIEESNPTLRDLFEHPF